MLRFIMSKLGSTCPIITEMKSPNFICLSGLIMAFRPGYPSLGAVTCYFEKGDSSVVRASDS